MANDFGTKRYIYTNDPSTYGVGKAYERFGLSLNAKKPHFIVIGRNISSINIVYNGASLEPIKELIYLGACFKENGIPSRR